MLNTVLRANAVTWERQWKIWLAILVMFLTVDVARGDLTVMSVLINVAALVTAHVIWVIVYLLVA